MRNFLLIISTMFLVSAAHAASQIPLDCSPKFANATIIHGSTSNDKFLAKGTNRLDHYIGSTRVETYTISATTNYLINTGSGNDTVDVDYLKLRRLQVCTGNGNDKVYAWNAAAVWVYSGSGNDKVRANATDGKPLRVYGGSGNDQIYTYETGASSTSLDGGDGSDCLSTLSTDPSHYLQGGNGNDYLINHNGGGTLSGSGGTDVCFVDGDERLVSCEVVTSDSPSSCRRAGWRP